MWKVNDSNNTLICNTSQGDFDVIQGNNGMCLHHSQNAAFLGVLCVYARVMGLPVPRVPAIEPGDCRELDAVIHRVTFVYRTGKLRFGSLQSEFSRRVYHVEAAANLEFYTMDEPKQRVIVFQPEDMLHVVNAFIRRSEDRGGIPVAHLYYIINRT